MGCFQKWGWGATETPGFLLGRGRSELEAAASVLPEMGWGVLYRPLELRLAQLVATHGPGLRWEGLGGAGTPLSSHPNWGTPRWEEGGRGTIPVGVAGLRPGGLCIPTSCGLG